MPLSRFWRLRNGMCSPYPTSSKDSSTNENLIRTCFGPSFTIADQAGEALASIGKPAVPALQKVIVKRGNDAARIRAIDALGQIGHEASGAVSALCKCARDDNESIRYHAVVSLGKVAPDPEKVVAPLTEALDDEAPNVKSAAVLALGAMGRKAEAALPQLVAMLDMNDMRSEFAGFYYPVPLRMDVAEAIGKIGIRDKIAMAKLEAMLQDEDSLVRIAAATAHCQLSDDPHLGLTVLRRELQDRSRRTDSASRAAAALGQLGRRALPVAHELSAAMDHEDPVVRAKAVEAIGAVRPVGFVDLIVPKCEDPEAIVRASAIESLGSADVDDPRLIDLFIEALSDPDWGVRFWSMEALSCRGRRSTKAIPLLKAMAASDDEWDRDAARKALRQIQSQEQPAKEKTPDKDVR